LAEVTTEGYGVGHRRQTGTQEVIYQDGLMVVKLDGKTMFEYRDPHADVEHELPTKFI
jgi:hypothetical protein